MTYFKFIQNVYEFSWCYLFRFADADQRHFANMGKIYLLSSYLILTSTLYALKHDYCVLYNSTKLDFKHSNRYQRNASNLLSSIIYAQSILIPMMAVQRDSIPVHGFVANFAR